MTQIELYADLNLGYPEAPDLAGLKEIREAVEATFRLAGQVKGANLLAGMISRKDNVIIKPNWVTDLLDKNHIANAVISHSTVIASIVAIAQEALEGEGRIAISDAPIQGAN
jgi:hypothetical protein